MNTFYSTKVYNNACDFLEKKEKKGGMAQQLVAFNLILFYLINVCTIAYLTLYYCFVPVFKYTLYYICS